MVSQGFNKICSQGIQKDKTDIEKIKNCSIVGNLKICSFQNQSKGKNKSIDHGLT